MRFYQDNKQNWAMHRIESTIKSSNMIINKYSSEGNDINKCKEVLIRSLVNDLLYGNDALINIYNSKSDEKYVYLYFYLYIQ